jgi:predicted CXXCH cytochrome family protein
MAYGQSVVGTAHDLSTGGGSNIAAGTDEVCVFCHTPHQTAAANAQQPLWNHALSATAAYGVYDSDTFNGDGTIADLGGAVAGSAAVSNLCLSCHDDTISLGAIWNEPTGYTDPVQTLSVWKPTTEANVGTDLTNDHPVNFTYDGALSTADGGLKDPSTLTNAVLFGGTLQCASCHDPHDDTAVPFLVVSNSGSDLCIECHNK